MSDIVEPWGTVELEMEVATWLRSLSPSDFGQAQFYVDLLERDGVLLDEPYTRQLFGKLRELRFYLGASRVWISYFIGVGTSNCSPHRVRKALPTRTSRGAASGASHGTLHSGRTQT